MSIVEQFLKRKVSAEEKGFVELDSLGIIYPKNNYEIFRPEFVVMNFDGNRYDDFNYHHLNGKKCRKFRKVIPTYGTIRRPEYLAERYLDTINKFKFSSSRLLNHEKELGVDCCPLTLYVREQVETNAEVDVRDLKIPIEILKSSYDFFDEKVAEYNKGHSSNNDFVK